MKCLIDTASCMKLSSSIGRSYSHTHHGWPQPCRLGSCWSTLPDLQPCTGDTGDTLHLLPVIVCKATPQTANRTCDTDYHCSLLPTQLQPAEPHAHASLRSTRVPGIMTAHAATSCQLTLPSCKEGSASNRLQRAPAGSRFQP